MKGTILVVLALVAFAKADEYETILKQKIVTSTPNVDGNRFANYAKNLSKSGRRFVKEINKSELDNVAGEQFTAVNRPVNPWSDFGSLKWGTKFEHLESHRSISGTGGNSWTIVVGKIGSRTGDNVKMRTFVGWSTCHTPQQHQTVSYRSCKRRLFWKKCRTEHRKIARGLTPDEVQLIQDGLSKSAHEGAAESAAPAAAQAPAAPVRSSNPKLTNFIKATNSIGRSHFRGTVVTDIKQNNLNQVISTIGHGKSSVNVAKKINGFQTKPRSGCLDLSTSTGKRLKVNLSWNAKKKRFTAISSR